MRRSSTNTVIILFLTWFLWASIAPCWAENLVVNGGERLLVVAPHPDDETLACGGLIQRVKALGGTVNVVYLTAGDGCISINPMALLSTHYIHRRIGLRRMAEAVTAMERLDVARANLIFLGYPDRGLMPLWQAHYGNKQEYRSRLTGADHVFYPGLDSWGNPYDRESLILSLTVVINSFRPTVIALPGREDVHPDHQAAHYFIKSALNHSIVNPRMLDYIVHYPYNSSQSRRSSPGYYAHYTTLWLIPAETECKKEAIQAYQSQFPAMNHLLNGFSRTEEIFYQDESGDRVSGRGNLPSFSDRS